MNRNATSFRVSQSLEPLDVTSDVLPVEPGLSVLPDPLLFDCPESESCPYCAFLLDQLMPLPGADTHAAPALAGAVHPSALPAQPARTRSIVRCAMPASMNSTPTGANPNRA